MPTHPLVRLVSIALCVEAGHNPFGPTCDVYFPDDPDAIMPWAGYRRDPLRIIEEGFAEEMKDRGVSRRG